MSANAETGKRLKRHQNEKVGSRVEGLFHILFEECPVAICITNGNARITAANERASAVLAYNSGEMVGMHISTFFGGPTEQERLQEDAKRDGCSIGRYVKLRRKDGTEIVCLVTLKVHENDEGKTDRYQYVIMDTNEENRALEDLLESEKRYALWVDNLTDGLWASEWGDDLQNMRFTYFTDSISKVLGYRKEELLGMKLEDVMAPASVERGLATLREQLALDKKRDVDPHRSWSVELEEYHESGGTIWVEARSTFLRNRSGRPVGTLGFIRDITERKRSEAMLRTLSSRLVEVQEAERRHIAVELHDYIGQALTSLKISLENMANLPKQDVKSGINDALASISDLMDRVRDLSLELRPLMLDDLGLMPALLRHFGRYKAQTNISVDFKQKGLHRRFAPELETAVYRIVQEGLTNVARHAKVKEVTVWVGVTRHELSLRIEDRGVGFDSGAALASCSTSGLAGIKERVLLLGGDFRIDSAHGAGTRLLITFPIRPRHTMRGK